MTASIDARNLSLSEVHQLFKYDRHLNGAISAALPLASLTEFEQQELTKIRDTFLSYYADGKISEGQIKFLVLAPLLQLAGFYAPTIKITLEEAIAEINIADEDRVIKGRMDILAVNRMRGTEIAIPFWILVIEAKNSSIEALEGLPQLLTYAYKGLENQSPNQVPNQLIVWGLTTNGLNYRFIKIERGDRPTYQIFPALSLIDPEPCLQLLQVLKAICQL